MQRWGWAFVTLTLCAAGPVLSAAPAPRSPLRPVAVVRLPRAGRGFNDYLIVDPQHHRLYAGYAGFAACSNNKLVVLNEENGQVVAVLPIGGDVDFAAYDPGLRRVYVPSGEGKITVIQQQGADHYRVLANVPTGRPTPRLAVDPATHRVYVVSEAGDHAEILVYQAIP